ncbi:MarR family transcriptional regulator [Lysobacter sp. SG-8]|uniref:MarR family transcriptional regulator n=1 Tax=Marilutibacter penaei TaxID=2759900 RepID=A0A7W3U1R0_9GAMM|nr:MarR family transcriptional regulator [Lysobacter penaei]MBB1087371.1 MarR family transcriptional regulator [Lysobacter penaei]
MNPPSSPCSGSTLGLLFRQVRDAMWARMAHELARAGHDLSFSQYITIKRLADGPVGATELARTAELNPGAMTRLLDKLEARGVLVRNPHPDDRRALVIELTPAGQSLWQDVNACGRRVRERALHGLSGPERDQLLSLLARVRDNLNDSGA